MEDLTAIKSSGRKNIIVKINFIIKLKLYQNSTDIKLCVNYQINVHDIDLSNKFWAQLHKSYAFIILELLVLILYNAIIY